MRLNICLYQRATHIKTTKEFDIVVHGATGFTGRCDGAINTRNVHCYNFLLGHAWGTDLVYDEMLITGTGDKGKALAKAAS